MKTKIFTLLLFLFTLTIFSACSEEEIQPMETTTSDQIGSERDGDGF